MIELPIPWWTFWLAAAFLLYTGLIWFFVREATRPREQQGPATGEHEPQRSSESKDPDREQSER